MPAELAPLTLSQVWGIPVALIGSVFLALGTILQHRGVALSGDGSDAARFRGSGVLRVLRRPTWIIGTLLLGVAIVAQLFSIFLAPLTVVQPLGVAALVLSAGIHARATRTWPDRATVRGVLCCVAGIGIFVGVAASHARSHRVTDGELVTVLVILLCVGIVVALAYLRCRARFTAPIYTLCAGVLFGFVATLAKVIIDRLHGLVIDGLTFAPQDLLLVACLIGLAAAALVGSYFVQNAHLTGTPDLVVAGLTVIDPMVGVTVGILVLGEMSSTSPWTIVVFALSGLLAIYGVVELAHRAAPTPAHPAEVLV